MAQYFKGDDLEQKFYRIPLSIFDLRSNEKDSFFENAFECFILGELLYDTNRAPLAKAIERDIFRESFFTVFNAFLVAGTFEAYLTVFRQIFGADVDVTFTVPAPGKLNIDIVATGIELSQFIYREIVDNAYVTDEVIDYDDDIIVFQGVKGFETQYELEQMLFEMVPAGIYTEITLTVGE